MSAKTRILLTLFFLGLGCVSFANSDLLKKFDLPQKEWLEENFYFQLAKSKIDVNEFLIGVIENFREDMKVGIPELKVPVLDPFKSKKPAVINVSDDKAEVKGNFTDIYVEGLSDFSLEYINADLHALRLFFHLRIPYLKAVGNYTIDGRIVKIIPIRGKGEFKVESQNITLAAKASIVTSQDNKLQLGNDFDVDLDFQKVNLQLENFLGGGRWTEILLKIVNDISKDLFNLCLPLLKSELNSSLLKVLNKHLKKLPITSITPGSDANEYVDQILDNVKTFIKEKNLEPMKLPDYSTNFTKEVAFITFNGEAKLWDGWLSGVSTIHRTDECEVKTNKTTISVSAHLGLNDLRLAYKGLAKFMKLGPSLIVGGRVKTVSFYFRIEQSNKKGAKPNLREFEIVELSTIWIDLSGLGPLTWILKWLLTGISKLVEDFIVNKVTDFVKVYMEKEFEKLSFPV